MKYYIIAGEASGDLHGSNLIKAIYKLDKNAKIRCWGGDLMQDTGATLAKHYKQLAFMGFIEVAKNIFSIFKNFSFCKKDIQKFHPDVLIFIDYSGFNLRIAKWAKTKGFRTNYYISPQVWASRASRIKTIKKNIDAMYVILPFEKEFYKKYDYKVTFVGHPLLDSLSERQKVSEPNFRKEHNLGEKPIIALLPGSRKQEIIKMLPLMLSLTNKFEKYKFVIAGAPSQSFEFYQTFIGQTSVAFINNKTQDLLSISKAALVASGTATLETALFKAPQVVCYKGNYISYQIARRLINLKFISLVNLIMDREIVRELIQYDFTSENLNCELNKILESNNRQKILEDYSKLEQKLGGKGASETTARLIVKSLLP